ncbi:MAG: DUF1592 domain-containing protein [Marinagarivorans sp.]|nr:DUF1592 domain-containing protein [Marinagarivorans sp.]
MGRSLFTPLAITALAIAALSGCTASTESSSSSTASNSSQNQTSSSPKSSSSSVTAVSSSPAAVSSSMATVNSSMAATSSSAGALTFPIGNVDRGHIYYTDNYKGDKLGCLGCHGASGAGPIAKITAGKNSYQHSTSAKAVSLAEYIYQYMPSTSTPGRCDTQCAADIAAYIDSWSINHSGNNDALVYKGTICDDRATYSARQLKLLTRSEYQNSAEDLTGININISDDLPDDSYIHGFNNNIGASVTEVHADSYLLAAERIAAWSKANQFAGVINCSKLTQTQCADTFIAGFAKKAFRRPLDRAESNAISALFDGGLTDNNLDNGIETAMTAVFSAPGFLYRSEQGTPVSSGKYDGSQYGFKGAKTLLKATDLQHIFGEAGDLDGAWKIRSKDQQPAKLEKHLTYTGSGTLLSIKVKGGIVNNVIPKMTIAVNSFSHVIDVDWEDYRTIKVYFPAIQGTHGTRVELDLRSKNYDQSYLSVHTIEYGEATLMPNAPDADAYALTPYEIATYLAYTYTGSTPDNTLMLAADNGELATDAQIVAQIGRLLGSPRAKQQLGDFAAQWLGTDETLNIAKDPAKYPELTANIRSAMAQEVRELFSHVVLDDTQPIERFFDADYTFVNKTLADYYGLSGAAGNGFTKVNGGKNRGGILTTGAFMTTYGNNDEASPIRRAANVRERLLCQHVPPPPPGIVIDREAAEKVQAAKWEAGELTNRERYRGLTQAEYCQGCHRSIINPLGFGMEDFDTIGRHRTIDRNGLTIDAQGTLIGTNSLYDVDSVSFYGAKELSHALAGLDSAKECFAQHLFRFATGTGSEVIDQNNPSLGLLSEQEKTDYACSVRDITAAMVAADGNPKEILKQLGALKLVRYRKEMNR